MRPWHIAAGAGLATSGVLLAFFLTDKAKRMEARGKRLEQSIVTGEGSTDLARRAQGIDDRLKTFAEEYTRQLAERSANEHLARHYGLTQERIQGIERLASVAEGL